MKLMFWISGVALCVACCSGAAYARQNQQSNKPHEHQAGVNERGDHAMGFSHLKTTHHFILLADGGSVEVTANDLADDESRDKIRQHLGHIAKLFAAGDFTAPMFIHDTTPPGTQVMTRLNTDITYKFENIEAGGRLRIETKSAEALEAIHEFLRFQIKDHATGDSLDVQRDK